jgi:hypothetical protein
VAGWRGQLVLSTFVRFVVTPQHLFVEASHSLLTPVKDEYQEVDRLLPQPTFAQAIRLGWRSLLRLPARLILAPAAITRAASKPITRGLRKARQRREILSALRFNYGASASPREWASDTRYQRYFQQLDKDLYAKVVEKTLLQSIVLFLDAKGIDTGELVERQTTILNNGVYVTGGASLTAESVAAGTGAQAKSGLAGAAANVAARAANLAKRS